MEIELRPLNLGEILDRTFQLYRARFLTFTGIAAFGAAMLLLWQFAQVLALRFFFGKKWPASAAATIGGIASMLSWGMFVLVLAVVLAAMTRAVTALYLGKTTGIAQSYSEVRRHWLRYILINASALIAAAVPIVIAGLALFVPVALAPSIRSLWGRNVLTLIFATSGFLLLCTFPLSTWLMLRYSLANAASSFEGIRVRPALKRSVQLSRGLRAKIFVLLLIAGVAQSLVAGFFILPAIPFVVRAGGATSIGMNLYTFGMGFVSHVLTVPIYGIGLTLFYLDARIRKEGFDVEWMLERSIEAERLADQPAAAPDAGLDLA